MLTNEKIQGLQGKILSIEIFAYIKRFGFQAIIRACKLLNETKKMRKFQNI